MKISKKTRQRTHTLKSLNQDFNCLKMQQVHQLTNLAKISKTMNPAHPQTLMISKSKRLQTQITKLQNLPHLNPSTITLRKTFTIQKLELHLLARYLQATMTAMMVARQMILTRIKSTSLMV